MGLPGVGPPRRQIAEKRAGFEEPDPGARKDHRETGKRVNSETPLYNIYMGGGAEGVLLHRSGSI